MLADAMMEKIQLMDTKEALAWVDDGSMGAEWFKNSLRILNVHVVLGWHWQ